MAAKNKGAKEGTTEENTVGTANADDTTNADAKEKQLGANGEGGQGSGDNFDDENDFTSRTAARDDVMWFRPEEGATVRGILKGKFVRQGGKDAGKAFYQVQATKPGVARGKEEEDSKEYTELPYEVGQLINVDEKAQLTAALDPLAESGGIHEVIIRAVKKMNLDKGRTMWLFDVKSKMLRAGTGSVLPKSNNGKTENIPF